MTGGGGAQRGVEGRDKNVELGSFSCHQPCLGFLELVQVSPAVQMLQLWGGVCMEIIMQIGVIGLGSRCRPHNSTKRAGRTCGWADSGQTTEV